MEALIAQEAFLGHEFCVLDYFLFRTRILFWNQQEDGGVWADGYTSRPTIYEL